MAKDWTQKAGDTEPITFNVDLDGVDDLSDLSSAELYARKEGEEDPHVDGGALDVHDSQAKVLAFDPVGQAADGGDAFGVGHEGDYEVYARLIWNDGDDTRHPNEEYREWRIEPVFEDAGG